MRKSTRALMGKHGWRIDRAIHNYIYFAFYYPYVKVVYLLFSFLSNYLSWFKPFSPVLKTAFDRYHAKILSSEDTEKIFSLDEDVMAVSERNKRIVPFRYAYKILFEEPDYIAVMDCPCKLALGAPEWSVNSCISVGRKTSQFWLDRCGSKYHARRISQAEALELIRAFREKGYLTQAFFKVATGGSSGVICNCHIDSCVSLKATQLARRFKGSLSMTAASGYSVRREAALCQNCGTCASYCQFQAMRLVGGAWVYDRDVCMGCELCVEHCPQQALSLYRDGDKCEPLDMDLVRADYV